MIIEKDSDYIRSWVIMVVFAVLVIGLAAISLNLLLKSNSLTAQLKKDKQALVNINEELLEIKSAKEKLAKENERYQADSISFLALNARLNEENEKFQKKLREAQKVIENQEAELQRVNDSLNRIDNKKNAAVNGREQSKIILEKEALIKKVKKLKANLRDERMLYHYNLGVAFAQAAFYDEAIMEYEKSLESNLNNPEAHYNLGLLYDNYKNEPKKAAIHYRKYLDLKPEAADKEEVEAWIRSTSY